MSQQDHPKDKYRGAQREGENHARGYSSLVFAGALLALVAITRHWLEQDMARHMLIEFPLLLGAGWMIAGSVSVATRNVLARCNLYGIAGFAFAALTLGFWMIPAALDAALGGPTMAIAKYVTLVAAGAWLAWSWPLAPPMMQAFFVGNVVWMMATVGLLYQEAEQPLCLYYLVDAQAMAGRGLVLLAVGIGLAWGYSAVRSQASLRYNPVASAPPGEH